MPTLTINGKEVTVPRGTPIIRAAAMLGFNIPHFCYHPALSAPANCRMCLVEVERARKLEPACYLKCTDGMVVHTESEKVKTARQAVLEFILVNHPIDCPICDQAGECKLQDYYMSYDAKPSRLNTAKVAKVKVHAIGPRVVYDGERCILCTRCVRFCDQITGTSELTVRERGDSSTIATFPGTELDNPYSMNVTDICPVGALTSRDFRFKRRVWLLSTADSICTGCSRGCNVHMEHHLGEVVRFRPRFNPDVNEYWMCDEGRLSYRELGQERMKEVRIGEATDLSWPRALRQLTTTLKGSENVAVVASLNGSCEDLFAIRHFADNALGGARIYANAKNMGEGDNFLISADKNANRAGFTAVFGEEALTRDVSALIDDIEAGVVKSVVLVSERGMLNAGLQSELKAAAASLENFVFVSAHSDELATLATATLPAATYAESDGTFINHQGRVQFAEQAFTPREDSLPVWEIFARMSKAAGAPLPAQDVAGIQAELFERGSA